MGGVGMYKLTSTQDRLIHRARIAKGHLEKVLEMLEEGRYCIDVINQSRAVQSALKEIDYLLLEDHLQTCVVDFVKKGKAKTSVDEIMRVFKKQEL